MHQRLATLGTLVLLLIGVTFAACGGDGGNGSGSGTTPTAPSRTPAQVSVTDIVVTSARAAGTGIDYTIKFNVKETGGSSGATLGTVAVNFYADNAGLGTVTASSAFASATLAAGSTTASRTISTNNPSESAPAATRVEVKVAYTDQSGTAGSASGTADVPRLLTPPSVSEFTASPSSIDPGKPSTLRWSVSGATSVSIQPDIGTVPASGSQVVTPQYTRTYTLTALNADGQVSRTATVSVNYPDVEYSVTGSTARIGTITYENAGGGTSQMSHVTPPWTYTFSGAKSGQFLYVSAQNDMSSGCVTVTIRKRGVIYKTSDSCGAYVIATASGSF